MDSFECVSLMEKVSHPNDNSVERSNACAEQNAEHDLQSYDENELVETFKFWNIKLHFSFATFLNEVCSQAEKCHFLEKERMLRDKIMLSVCKELRECLFAEIDLDLCKAINICESFEENQNQLSPVKNGDVKLEPVKLEPVETGNIDKNVFCNQKDNQITSDSESCDLITANTIESVKINLADDKNDDECKSTLKSSMQCDYCGKSFPTFLKLRKHKLLHPKKQLNPEIQPAGSLLSAPGHTGVIKKCQQNIAYLKKRKNCKQVSGLVSKIANAKHFYVKFPLRTSLKSKEHHKNGQKQLPKKRMKYDESDAPKEKEFVCVECEERFTSKQFLSKHTQKEHASNITYKCTSCCEVFVESGELKIHRQQMHRLSMFPQCHKSFSSKQYLDRHCQRHDEKLLENHMEIQVNHVKTYQCEHCGKCFQNSSKLNTHKRIHSGVKPCKCSYCDKAFYDNSSLKCHLRIHTKERPYVCKKCGASFIQSNHLLYHSRQHTGEKPFKCNQCDKTFRASGGLKRHILSHTNERPYQCEECGKSYSRKDNFMQHQKIHRQQNF